MTTVQLFVLIMFIMLAPDMETSERKLVALMYMALAVIVAVAEILK